MFWNGTALPTTFLNSTELNATIPASDLAVSGQQVVSVQVTVRNTNSTISSPQVFSIVASDVNQVANTDVSPGQSGNITVPPVSPGQASVALTLNNTFGSQSVAVTAASYQSNPAAGTSFDLRTSYVDIQVDGATAGNSLVSSFYYANTIIGVAANALKLLYFDGMAWEPVLSSGGVPPAKSQIANLDGTTSGGRFTVTFDSTSTPALSELTGTPIALAVDTEPPVISCPSDVITNTDTNGSPVVVNFTVSATDNSGTADVVCNPRVALSFSPGTNLVNCTATDPSGNTNTCSFAVVVITPSAPPPPTNLIVNGSF